MPEFEAIDPGRSLHVLKRDVAKPYRWHDVQEPSSKHLQEGTYHKRLFTGPSTNNMKK